MATNLVIEDRQYSGRIAIANLSAAIDGLERCRAKGAAYPALLALSNLLFTRGDLLGRIADHDRAERIAIQAAHLSPDAGAERFIRARLATRFHRFDEAAELLDEAQAAGHPVREIDVERAALFHAIGQYPRALVLRERLAQENPGIHTLGALAATQAEMGRWAAAEATFAAAADADSDVSPLPRGQLFFEWATSAMRRGELDRAEALFAELAAFLPQHVPGCGHRAEVTLGRGQPEIALALITPLVRTSDDPRYRAILAKTLAALGDKAAASREARRTAARYDVLLALRPDAYAEHAAAFFLGIGNRPLLALALAAKNWTQRDTPQAHSLLVRAQRGVTPVRRVA